MDRQNIEADDNLIQTCYFGQKVYNLAYNLAYNLLIKNNEDSQDENTDNSNIKRKNSGNERDYKEWSDRNGTKTRKRPRFLS